MAKGQFQHIRRNCSRKEDFTLHTEILKESFVAKGYNQDSLGNELQKVSAMNRNLLLAPKVKELGEVNLIEWAFITTFSSQYWCDNKIMKKRWQVLKNDRVLGLTLPDKPNVIFRRSNTLKDALAPSAVNPPPRS